MPKPTKIAFQNEALHKILRGVSIVYEAVKMSFGPEGGNALMYRTYNRGPRITNDGVTISDVIEPIDEFESLVANVFKEAAKKTNERAGDGTTATTIIGGRLILDIIGKALERSSVIGKGNKNVIAMKNDMLKTKKHVIEEIKKAAKKVETLEELEHIATISVEDAELGKIIANMAWVIGTDGFIDVVEGHKEEIETELIEGARFPLKVPAKIFVNNPARYEMIAEQVPVMITDYKMDSIRSLEFLNNLKQPKIVIIAPEFSEQVLIEFVKAIKNNFIIYPIKSPSLRTEQYEDLALYAGATFVSRNSGKKLRNVIESDLGYFEKIVVKDSEAREDAVIMGGKGSEHKQLGKELVESDISKRMSLLEEQIKETQVDSHKKLLQRRIASLASSMGVIRVGSTSNAEGLYRKMKIEDAVYACKAALEDGYVKGGGQCLKEIAELLPQDDITRPALLEPYEQIMENTGGEEIPETVIDPAKAIYLAVEHGISVAAHLATVQVIIAEIRDKNPVEGYEAIANALQRYTSYWAKERGLYKENQDEMDADLEHQLETHQTTGD